MTKKEVKEFFKNHWKELAAGAAVCVGGVIIYTITKQKPKVISEVVGKVLPNTDLAKPVDWSIGELTELWDEGFGPQAIVNDVSVSDLGNLGKELLKIDGVKETDGVSIVIGVLNKVNE